MDLPVLEDDLLLFLTLYSARKLAPRYYHDPLYLNRNRGRENLVNWRRKPSLYRAQLGCSIDTFDELVVWIRSRMRSAVARKREVSVYLDEKVAIFLYIVRFGASYTAVSGMFHRSRDTISQ